MCNIDPVCIHSFAVISLMAAPASAASWQPPTPGPGDVERAFAPLGPMGQGVLHALDAYREDRDEAPLVAMIQSHANLELQPNDPVPYEWQVGRFMRHAVDTRNVDGLCLLADIVIRAHDGLWLWYSMPVRFTAGEEQATQYAIRAAFGVSLHPDKAAAVQLFRDVVEIVPRAHVAGWIDFASDLLHTAEFAEWDRMQRTDDGEVTWKAETKLREFLAKAEKSLAIGSPFPLAFERVSIDRWAGVSFDLFHVAVRAFIQSDRREASHRAMARDLTRIASRRHSNPYGLVRTLNEGDARRLVVDLQHFIQLRWPSGSNKAQTDTIQLLANHLARSQIAEPRVIPSIMDFVREVPPASPAAYRQTELRIAREADARAYIASARVQVASAAAAPSATPTRPREGGDAGTGDGAASKRRA